MKITTLFSRLPKPVRYLLIALHSWYHGSKARKVKAWLIKHNEFLPMAIALVTFLGSPVLLRRYDETAGVYDVGVLQVIIFSVISFCVFASIVWMTLKVNWPSLRTYFETEFVNDFKILPPCQKICISLSVYFALFISLVLLSRVIAA
jgi:hypothetical protein